MVDFGTILVDFWTDLGRFTNIKQLQTVSSMPEKVKSKKVAAASSSKQPAANSKQQQAASSK